MKRQGPEADLVDGIIEVAHLFGWLAYHQRPAWTTKGYRTALQGDAGYPDLTLVKPGQPILFVEAKSEQGRLSPAQGVWLQALAQARGHRTLLVRPSTWDDLLMLLTKGDINPCQTLPSSSHNPLD